MVPVFVVTLVCVVVSIGIVLGVCVELGGVLVELLDVVT